MANLHQRKGWEEDGAGKMKKKYRSFKEARKFARTVESQMERNVFEDYSGASGTTLKEILIKYRDEKTVLKKGVESETSKINFLIRHKISLNSLMRLKSHQIYKLMKELALSILKSILFLMIPSITSKNNSPKKKVSAGTINITYNKFPTEL